MTNETGLLRDLNLKPGDRVTDPEGRDVNIEEHNGVLSVCWINGLLLPVERCIDTYTVTHREPSTIGTLKEIGAKVGDVVEDSIGREYIIHHDFMDNSTCSDYRILSQSPVRTVTKKEIVPGVYGIVEISEDERYNGGVGVYVNSTVSKQELTAAIATLTEIRDAL